MVQILTFFCKNNLFVYIAKEKYKMLGSKNGLIRNFQVMPLLNLYKLHLDIFSELLEQERWRTSPTSDFSAPPQFRRPWVIFSGLVGKYFLKITFCMIVDGQPKYSKIHHDFQIPISDSNDGCKCNS